MIAACLKSKNCRRAFFVSFVLLTTLPSCQKSKTTTSATPSKRPKIDACGLITNEEVQAIQTSPIKDAKGSEQADGSFRIAQCFYTAETFNQSVSLAVTQGDPASPNAG